MSGRVGFFCAPEPRRSPVRLWKGGGQKALSQAAAEDGDGMVLAIFLGKMAGKTSKSAHVPTETHDRARCEEYLNVFNHQSTGSNMGFIHKIW